MFSAIKRLIGVSPKVVDQGGVLAAWAKAEGHAFKHVTGRKPGYVVETKRGWRAEWGASQRSLYIHGQELRFRSESSMPHDVQMVMLTRALAQTLETDVFSRYTNDMQTQIDNSLPDEMRWLAMHPQVDTPQSPLLAKRFVILSNSVEVSQLWLDTTLIKAFEEAATTWWTDSLMLIITVNRGMLTFRMGGDEINPAQLKMVGDLFDLASRRLHETALQTAA